MLRSDNDPGSGTAATFSLRQSPFVFCPEDAEICRKMRERPEPFRDEAREAILAQEQSLRELTQELLARIADCRNAAEEGAKTVSAFGERLPVSFFGTGDGEAWMLPFGLMTEQVRQTQSLLGQAGVGLYRIIERLTNPLPPGIEQTAEVLEDAALLRALESLRGSGRFLRSVSDEAAEENDRFLRGTVEEFFIRSAKAADLTHKGEKMRFSALARLCGEFRNAAQRYGALCTRHGEDVRRRMCPENEQGKKES